MEITKKPYKRRVLPFESLFIHQPGVIVGFIAGITGKIDEYKFANAVKKLVSLYPILRSKLTVDKYGEEWIEEAPFEIPMRTVPRIDDDTWKRVFEEAEKYPIDLEKGPFYEFILVKSETKAEIIFRGHHMMTDGIAMTRILDLILQFMRDPNMTIKTYKEEELPNGKTLRKCVKPKLTLKQKIQNTWDDYLLFPLINLEWKRTKLKLSKEDIVNSHKIYMSNLKHLMLTDAFTERETTDIFNECKKHNITINSCLATAFLAVRSEVDPEHENNRQYVAVDLRRHLGENAHQAINCYASTLTTNFAYDGKKSFWENAENYHKLIKADLDACAEVTHVKNFSHLPTSFVWATSLAGRMQGLPDKYKDHALFKKIGPKSIHVVAVFMRVSLKFGPTFCITNLKRGRFTYDYGDLKLDSFIMSPSFVIYPPVSLLLSVITVNNKLTMSYHAVKPINEAKIDYDKILNDVKCRFKEFMTNDIFK
ncbi:MAG: condensation domain-containing protein [Oscillospiraceae bacterium]|nr:condensation domain-containing protein [Oscillospiraceae bacterium]